MRLLWARVFGAAAIATLTAAGILQVALTREAAGWQVVLSSLGLAALFSWWAFVGAVIAARTGNPVGWLLIAIPIAFGVQLGAVPVFEHGVRAGASYAATAYWLSQWPFFTSLLLLIAIFYLFPSGTLPSSRWRWPWRAYVTAGAITMVGFALLPDRFVHEDTGAVVSNPVGIEPLEPVLGVVLGVAGAALVVSALLAFVSLVARFRAGTAEERQQLRWLFAVGVAAAIAFAGLMVLGPLGEVGSGVLSIAAGVDLIALALIVAVGIPLATTVAVFKYRLYDLDLVIRKAVLAAILAAFIGVVYVAIVAGVGALVGSRADTALAFVAAAILAVAFQPARDRARRLADRLVYGARATPYEVLSHFSTRMGEAYASEDILPRMAQIVGEGTGAERAAVWLHVGGDFRREAAWPGAEPKTTVPSSGDALPELDGVAVEVRHRGELLGAITVDLPRTEPLDPGKEKPVGDLASQAGLVLRNVRLIEELRGSRQRLVAAQDEERRRIERNIHDGAQQQLVALSVKLRLAESLVPTDPRKATEMLSELRSQTAQTLDDLRDLARAIHPPLLAEKGLREAVDAQARRAPVPVELDADGVGRYPQDIEAAVYFSVLEAMNNVAKYARASVATIRLRGDEGGLEFEVSDDGVGFELDAAPRGTGLQGMADRLEAVGGALQITSSPGEGTTISGWVRVASQQ